MLSFVRPPHDRGRTLRGATLVYLGLGSNLGDRQENLRAAVGRLSEEVAIERVSAVYETSPVGYDDQPYFLNAVLAGRTGLGPLQLLRFAKRIERELGRVESFRNAPRVIDIDILFHGDALVETKELTVPHPGVAERAFVLVPLAEIAPGMVHPVNGATVADLLAGVSGIDGVRLVGRLDAGESESGS